MATLLLNPLASAAVSQLDLSQALPTYTRSTVSNAVWDVPAAEQEHRFHLNVKKTNVPWLTLTVRSRAASEDDVPTFYQGGEVAGSVRLELAKEELLDDVTVALYGRLTVYTRTATMPSNFLFQSRKLYSAVDDTSTSTLKRGRLSGTYEWPFSFRLPKGVSIVMSSAVLGFDGDKQRYRLPPTFADEEAGVQIEYLLSVRANRGGFKSSSKLVMPLNYIPLARPSPPTILRQLAYQQGLPLVGPEGDPDGWKTLDPVQVVGTLFKTVTVEAQCTLSLARPLMYTRGAPIHLRLIITSTNVQLLDLLQPSSLQASLVHHMHFGDDVAFWPRFSKRLAPHHTVKSFPRASATWWNERETIMRAQIRPNATSGSDTPPPPPLLPGEDPAHTRVFAGEILVPEELSPACEILQYSQEYKLELYPFTAIGFVSTAPPKTALIGEEVGIVTAFAQAPRPCSYASPQYDPSNVPPPT